MKTRLVTANQYREVWARVPELADVESLQVGDLAPDCFGKLAYVTRIYHRGVDLHGAAFVCYYTAMGIGDTAKNGCGCSASMKDGELVRTVALSNVLTSAECDQIEADMVREVAA